MTYKKRKSAAADTAPHKPKKGAQEKQSPDVGAHIPRPPSRELVVCKGKAEAEGFLAQWEKSQFSRSMEKCETGHLRGPLPGPLLTESSLPHPSFFLENWGRHPQNPDVSDSYLSAAHQAPAVLLLCSRSDLQYNFRKPPLRSRKWHYQIRIGH